jgi:hypothetical protein
VAWPHIIPEGSRHGGVTERRAPELASYLRIEEREVEASATPPRGRRPAVRWHSVLYSRPVAATRRDSCDASTDVAFRTTSRAYGGRGLGARRLDPVCHLSCGGACPDIHSAPHKRRWACRRCAGLRRQPKSARCTSARRGRPSGGCEGGCQESVVSRTTKGGRIPLARAARLGAPGSRQ